MPATPPQQGTDREAESQAIRGQLAELRTSLEGSRVQHEEELARIRQEHEEEKTQLSQQRTDREAESQASADIKEKLVASVWSKLTNLPRHWYTSD